MTVIRWIIGFEHFGRLGIKLGVISRDTMDVQLDLGT